jgi:site-specific DNA-methyltransferase (adenine-specific)
MDWKNRLYFGDNLDILRRQVPHASVDLTYLDPPFNSNATYNVLFKENVAQGPHSGPFAPLRVSSAAFQLFPAAQITAFEDSWQWGLEPEAVYKEIVTSGPSKLGTWIQFGSHAEGRSLPDCSGAMVES